MAIRGIDAFLNMLAAAGVQYIFGNPGTTELPLSDALVGDRRFQYVLGLQEVPLVAMADGYAMASRKLGVVNVHICCGLGNAMGMLYNAFREGTPLLLTAGQQDRRLKFEEPILWGQMVEVTRPWTKWSVEVDRVEDLPSAMRRAMQIALTPPTGPVFMSIPVDVQTALAEELELTPPRLPDRRVRPPYAALERAADMLLAQQIQPFSSAAACRRPMQSMNLCSWPNASAPRSFPKAARHTAVSAFPAITHSTRRACRCGRRKCASGSTNSTCC